LRLFSQKLTTDSLRIWDIPNVIGQKFPADTFTVTTKLNFSPVSVDEKTGLIILGMDYSFLYISKSKTGFSISQNICIDANNGGKEETIYKKEVANSEIYLRVKVGKGAVCSFSYSTDGNNFEKTGCDLKAKKGGWTGAKIGLFSAAPFKSSGTGYSDFDWFRFSK
jgi:beta-xylosidase